MLFFYIMLFYLLFKYYVLFVLQTVDFCRIFNFCFYVIPMYLRSVPWLRESDYFTEFRILELNAPIYERGTEKKVNFFLTSVISYSNKSRFITFLTNTMHRCSIKKSISSFWNNSSDFVLFIFVVKHLLVQEKLECSIN